MQLLVQKGSEAYAPLLPPAGADVPAAAAQNAITPCTGERVRQSAFGAQHERPAAIASPLRCRRGDGPLRTGGQVSPRRSSPQISGIAAAERRTAARSVAFAMRMDTPLTLADAIGGVPAVVVFADYTCRTLCGPILEFTAAGPCQNRSADPASTTV